MSCDMHVEVWAAIETDHVIDWSNCPSLITQGILHIVAPRDHTISGFQHQVLSPVTTTENHGNLITNPLQIHLLHPTPIPARHQNRRLRHRRRHLPQLQRMLLHHARSRSISTRRQRQPCNWIQGPVGGSRRGEMRDGVQWCRDRKSGCGSVEEVSYVRRYGDEVVQADWW